jgi:hypothetical protein
LLPGFVFRSRLKRGERTSLDYSPFGQTVSEALFWATVAHIVWLGASSHFFGQQFDVGVLLRLLSADPAGQNRAIEAVSHQFRWISAPPPKMK